MSPSVETLIFRSGLVSADQLGELAQLHAQTGRPIDEIAIERGIIAPHVLQQILRGEAVTRAAPAPVPVVPAPAPVHEPAPAPVSPTPPPAPAEVEAHATALAASAPAGQPQPAPVAATSSQEPVYAVVVRIQGGDTLQDSLFRANEEAASRASSLARRLAAQPDEWVAIGGSLVRPTAVLAVSVEPRMSGPFG